MIRLITKLIVLLLLFASISIHAQVIGDYKSKSSGNWGDFTIWQVYDGTVWVDAISGQIPGGTQESNSNSVYIEAAHTIILEGNHSCKDLHLNTTSDVVRLNTQNSILDVWGKMRFYQGNAPGLNTPIPITSNGITGWITTSSDGAIRFRGTSDWIVMAQGQVNANNSNSGWNLEFAFDEGFTGQINDRIRAGNITVTSGTLFLNNPTAELRIGTNNGASDLTPNGQFLIKSGATLKGGLGIFKKSNVAAESIITEVGSTLIISNSGYVLAAATLSLNGTMILQKSISFPTEAGRTSAVPVNSINNLNLEGTGAKYLSNNVTVTGILSLKDSSSLNNASFALSFGSNGTLEYNGATFQTTTNAEFPSVNGPANLIINNSKGVALHSDRTINNQLTLSNGLLYLNDYNLTLGSGSTSVAGTVSTTNMIVTNGTGKLLKVFNAPGTFIYPIGDSTSTDEYTPVNITINSASLLDGTTSFGIRVIDSEHPTVASTSFSDKISRYWEVSTNMTNYSYNGVFQYLTNDVSGTEGNIIAFKFNDESSNSSRLAISSANDVAHQLSINSFTQAGFISGANFGCTITSNSVYTPQNTVFCNSVSSIFFNGVKASVTSGTPTYQWQRNINGGSWSNIVTNGQSEDYSESGTLTPGTYNYRRIVSDPSYCASADTSSAITITVNAGPSILSNPSDISACQNDNIVFSTFATGSGIIYQWQVLYNGSGTYVNLSNDAIHSNVNTPSLNLSSINSSVNYNRYRCKVTGCSIAYSAAALLKVNNPTIINSNPINQSICDGLNTTFGVNITGTNITYQWQVSIDNGQTFNNVSNGGVYSNATSNLLTLTGVNSTMNNYKYKCSLVGACPSGLTSQTATLIVKTNPIIAQNPSNVTACLNSDVSFSTTVSGTGLSYQWQVLLQGTSIYTNLVNDGTYSNVNSTTLNISSVNSSFHYNRYRCKITGCSVAYTQPGLLIINSGCGAKLFAYEAPTKSINGYPNPFINKLYLNGFEGSATVIVKDIDGRVLLTKENYNSDDELTVDENLEEGIYLVELRSDKNFQVIKLVKTK